MSKASGPKPIDRWLALGSVAMGIALFLVPKSEAVVLLSLVAIFLVLLHPIWNFWWIEKSLLRRTLAVIVLVAMLFVFGVYVWPLGVAADTSVSRWTFLTEWLAGRWVQCAVYLGGLPWRWIVPGFAIGAVIVWFMMRRRQRNLACPDKQLYLRDAMLKELRSFQSEGRLLLHKTWKGKLTI